MATVLITSRRARIAGQVLASATIFAGALFLSHPMLTVQAGPKTPVERGATLFRESGCEHCHGPDGRGTDLAPDLGTIGKRLSKAQIEHQIHDGGGGMPSFAQALQPDEITALVAYLSTKKKLPKPPPPVPVKSPPPA